MKVILFPFLLLSLFVGSCTYTSSTKTTTRTFNGGELIYHYSITDAQANALGEYLTQTGFYDGKAKTVDLSKQNGIIHFAMVVKDEFANSSDYQTQCIAFINDLEKEVFKGGTVEIDFCDDQMKVKKNLKGEAKAIADTDTKETPATNVSDTESENPFQFIAGYWLCSNITGGGDMDAAQQARDLEILQSNFDFNISESGTFTSNFINQNDLKNPVPIKGNYAISNGQINFTELQINNQSTPDQKMSFRVNMPTADELQLISQTPGKANLVMSFQRQQ